VQIKAWRILKPLVDEDYTVRVDSNSNEPHVVKIAIVQNFTKEVLSFMESQKTQGFTTTKLLMMERICDELTKIGVAHLSSTNSVIL
jgi:hypothetical protein